MSSKAISFDSKTDYYRIPNHYDDEILNVGNRLGQDINSQQNPTTTSYYNSQNNFENIMLGTQTNRQNMVSSALPLHLAGNSNQSSHHMNGQLNGQLNGQMVGNLNIAMGNSMNGQMSLQMANTMSNQIGQIGQIGNSMNGIHYNTLNSHLNNMNQITFMNGLNQTIPSPHSTTTSNSMKQDLKSDTSTSPNNKKSDITINSRYSVSSQEEEEANESDGESNVSTTTSTRKRRRKSKKLTKRDFIEHMHMTQPEAARCLDVCLTTFKNQFAKYPLRWPTPSERKQLIKQRKKNNSNLTNSTFIQSITVSQSINKNSNSDEDEENIQLEHIDQKIQDYQNDTENQRKKNDLLRNLIACQDVILQELRQPSSLIQNLNLSTYSTPTMHERQSPSHFSLASPNNQLIPFSQPFIQNNHQSLTSGMNSGLANGISPLHTLSQPIHLQQNNFNHGLQQSMQVLSHQSIPHLSQNLSQSMQANVSHGINQGIPIGFPYQIPNNFFFPHYQVEGQLNNDL